MLKPTASKPESDVKSEKRPRKQRTDTVLVFDPTQKVPDHVLESIIDEWLVPCLVGEFSLKRQLSEPLVVEPSL